MAGSAQLNRPGRRQMGIKPLNFKFALIGFDGSEFIISHFDARKIQFGSRILQVDELL